MGTPVRTTTEASAVSDDPGEDPPLARTRTRSHANLLRVGDRQPRLPRQLRKLHPVAHGELLPDGVAMPRDGLGGAVQRVGDLLDGHALAEQREHLSRSGRLG